MVVLFESIAEDCKDLSRRSKACDVLSDMSRFNYFFGSMLGQKVSNATHHAAHHAAHYAGPLRGPSCGPLRGSSHDPFEFSGQTTQAQQRSIRQVLVIDRTKQVSNKQIRSVHVSTAREREKTLGHNSD